MSGLKILMYHAIGEPGEPATRFVVPLPLFERQLAWLERGRYTVLRLDDAVELLRAREPLPRRSLVITFDDGTSDVAELARPALERHGFPATAFLVTAAMGARIGWTDEPGLARRAVMSWEQAKSLAPLVTVAPHSRTHPSLPALGDDELAAEVRESRNELEGQTSASSVFAYPFGRYDARVAAAVERAGYVAACTVRAGVNDTRTPLLELRRYEIRGNESLPVFAAVVGLDAAYRGLRLAGRLAG